MNPADRAELLRAAQAIVDATGQTLSGQWVIHGDGEKLMSDLSDAIAAWNTRAGHPGAEGEHHQFALELAQAACDWRWGTLDGLSPDAVIYIKRQCEAFASDVVRRAFPATISSPSRPDTRLREAVERLRMLPDIIRQSPYWADTREALPELADDLETVLAASRLQHVLAQTKEGEG